MKIQPSNTTTSSIIAMGQRLRNAEATSGKEYLLLNRGVNSVVPIDIQPIVDEIDFNSMGIQAYPGSKGKVELREAINQEYFAGKASTDNILITGGGISGLDVTFQNLDVTELLLPKLYWGTYRQLCQLRRIPFSTYANYDYLQANANLLNGKAVVICDPGNPLGDKFNDNDLLQVIRKLNQHGVTIIVDSPYRRLFSDENDIFYQELLDLEQVIIIESFSKTVGLSGQRIGFMHSVNSSFNSEALLRMTYATNGINSFAQILMIKLLITEEGKQAVSNFKNITTKHIKQNIDYLKEHNLLATELYNNTQPVGIFCAIKKSADELFEHRIGSVDMSYFTHENSSHLNNISRILVSVPHEKFVSFFRTIN